jgi:hypothetical protein
MKVFDRQTSKEMFPGYYQVNGRRKMLQLGVLSVFRWGLFLGNLFLNALFLGVCFVCLWLILRFQWTHALGFAAVLWLALSLAVVPMLLAKTQEVARQRAASPPATAGEPAANEPTEARIPAGATIRLTQAIRISFNGHAGREMRLEFTGLPGLS